MTEDRVPMDTGFMAWWLKNQPTKPITGNSHKLVAKVFARAAWEARQVEVDRLEAVQRAAVYLASLQPVRHLQQEDWQEAWDDLRECLDRAVRP